MCIFLVSPLTVAFQLQPSLSSKKKIKVLQAAKGSNDQSPTPKKKNRLGDSILFGKPQYNWVTGKTEAKMASTYIHNWNTSSKTRMQSEQAKALSDGKGVDKNRDRKRKPWWNLS